jgi:hypothetical protein
MSHVDAAAGGQAPIFFEADKGSAIPMKKRKMTDDPDDVPPQTTEAGVVEAKKTKLDDTPPSTSEVLAGSNVTTEGDGDDVTDDGLQPLKRSPMPKAREIRLEQNRKAARESRRRKKVMIEELQRSVIFFSRANGTLKQQNDELSRLLMQAQAQVSAVESGQGQQQAQANANQEAAKAQEAANQHQQQHQYANAANMSQQAQANTVATQAMYESQGFPPGAARSAAQTMNATAPAGTPAGASLTHGTPQGGNAPALPTMQPGATMQAMANFQQAAAAAMQAAMGMNPAVAAHAQHPQGVQAQQQQAYMDTMNALMQQQAAAAGQQYAMGMAPQMHGVQMIAQPMMTWAPVPQQQQPPQTHQQQG